MSNSFRILTLSGLTALGFSSAHAAVFWNHSIIPNIGTVCLSSSSAHGVPAGAPAIAFYCEGQFNQMWNWEGSEIQGIGTTNVDRKCLDVRGGGTADGTIVQIFDCNGTGAQRWSYSDSGQIVNLGSGKCLDTRKNNTSFPSVVIQACNVSSATQKWHIL